MLLQFDRYRTQEVCESRGGRPGLPVPNSPYVLCGRKATFEEEEEEEEEEEGEEEEEEEEKDGLSAKTTVLIRLQCSLDHAVHVCDSVLQTLGKNMSAFRTGNDVTLQPNLAVPMNCERVFKK